MTEQDGVFMKPIAAEVIPETQVDVDRITWKTALSRVGAKSRDTGNEYRKWMNMLPGEQLDRESFARFAVMFFYCNAGKGRHFSRCEFLKIEADPDRLADVIKRFNIHGRILTQKLHTIGDFSRYGLPTPGR